MADGVHLVAHAVQAAVGEPARRAVLVDAGLAKLPRRDPPMLSSG